TIGTGVLVVQGFMGTLRITGKNILGGIALGVPNFFSIYFLVMALRSEGFESTSIFTINNVAIVLVSTFLGIGLFRERLIPKNWIGIALAIISILLVANG
ncbi:MAG: EamA/RhaT family transporter, partial [Gillisia sp.]|nr:EamA/RhaT family transporter [Gillisia sp.]